MAETETPSDPIPDGAPSDGTDMMDVVCAGLDLMELTYTREDARSLVIIHMTATCGSVRCAFDVKRNDDLVIFYAYAPASVPETHRTPVAVYLAYCNYGLKTGSFEFDLDDGEIRFKNSIFVGGSALSREMVAFMLAHAVSLMDRFFPGLMAVVYGGNDPKETYDRAMEPTAPTDTDQ